MDRPGAVVAIVVAAVVSSLLAVGGVVWLVVGHPGVDGRQPARPAVATRAEFCAEFGDLMGDSMERLEDHPDDYDFGPIYRDYGRRVEAVGLPRRAPLRVRPGFEYFVRSAQQMPDGLKSPEDTPTDGPYDPVADEAYRVFDLWARRLCHMNLD